MHRTQHGHSFVRNPFVYATFVHVYSYLRDVSCMSHRHAWSRPVYSLSSTLAIEFHVSSPRASPPSSMPVHLQMELLNVSLKEIRSCSSSLTLLKAIPNPNPNPNPNHRHLPLSRRYINDCSQQLDD